MVGREELQLDEYKAKDILYAGDAPINEASLHALLGGSALAICFRFLDPAKPMSDQPIQKTAFDQYKSYSPTREEIWRQRREEKMRKKEEALEKRARRLSEMQRLARQAIEDEREARRFEKEQRKLDLLKSGSPNLTGVYGVHKIRPAPPGADGVGASAHYFPDSTPKEKPKWQLGTPLSFFCWLLSPWELLLPRDWMHSYGNCSYAIHCHGDIHGLNSPRNLSDNKITELDESSLRLPSNLVTLELSRNEINAVRPSTFKGMGQLLTLRLSYNNLTLIEYGAFDGLTSLENLDLSYNKIEVLRSETIMNLKSLRFLSLRFNGMYNLDYKAWIGHKHALRVNIDGNNFSCEWLATAIRDFSNGYSNMEPTIAVAAAKDPSLKGIPCVHSETNEEEPHLIVQATDERLLVMISKILEAIEKQTKVPILLAFMVSIKSDLPPGADGVGASAHYFPDSTPKEKPKWQLVRYATVVFLLASVTLGSCSCPRDWMHSYGNCSYAIHCHGDIHGLKLPEECLSSNYPANVTLTLDNPSIFNESDPKIDWSLLSSVVSFRAIGKWPQESLAMVEKMDGLTKLYLSGNQIKHINGSPFYRLFYLEVVDLSYNRLSQIKNLLQMEMQPSKLQKLVLAYNAIENIPDDTFDQVTFLVELDLSNNSISNLNNMTFSQLSQLKVLKLSNNNIFDLDGAINSLKVLRHLYLKGNQIEKIDLQSLQIIYDLDTFDVSANRLEKLFPEWLSRHWRHFGSNSKCKIILSENYITSLPNATSEIKMRRFSRDVVGNKLIDVQLDLSKNSISNIEPYALSYIMHLTSLDLSHNKLITFVVNVDDLKHVKYLNLSKNYIDHLDYESFASMTNLQNLDLSFNRLQNLPDQTFVNNFILRYVNMSNNYFDAIKRLNIKIFHPEGGVLDLSYNGLSSLSMPNGEGLRLMHLSLHANEITDVSLVELSFQKDLKILDLSDNKITELDESSLRLPSNLVTLELSRNEINAVRPSTFKGMGQLLTLRLSYNNLTLIEYGAFDGLTSLENLDLSYNKIEVLRSETIMNLKSLRFLSLRFNGMYNLDYKAWIGHKHALRVNIDGNNFTCEWLATAIRDFSNGYSNMEPTIAVAAAKDPSLKGIPCVHSETNEEEPHLIVQATDERLLVMISKILEAIEKQTKLIKAQLVDKVVIAICMVAQSYSQLPEATLTPFPEVGCKRKSHYSSDYIRECSDPWYCRNVISSLEFDSSNELQGSIEKGWFEGFLIQELNLGGQHLNSIENYAFTGLVSLQTLLLNNNNLNLLSNHSFKSLPNLKDLDLSYNDLINFDIVTDDLLRLEKLSLHHNKITQISSNNFKGLSTLQFLDLSHNNIAHFESKSFKSLEQLSSLKVSDNPLTGSIEEGTFDGTKSDVSFEKIAEIPVTEVQIAHSYIRNVTQLNLKRFHRLETLVLSNNAVSKLEIGALSNLRALKNFDLSFNNLSSIQPGAFMNNTYLLYLNISHNNLIEINYGIFHGLIYLKTLDLSYNNIKSLHNGRLYDVENLERLIADYNKIDSISPYEFSGTSLATLSIGGNPLPCEVLVNLKKGSFEFTITAITSDKTNPNVGGVTCNKDSYVDRSKPKTSNESDNLLIDIRNILFNISQEHMVKESVTITHDAPYVANISEQQVKLNQNILDSVAKLSSVSNMTSTLINVNSDTNLLLGKILKVLSSKDSTAPQTVKSTFAVVKDNATSENLIPYINKIKEALEETIAVEKQNIMIDLDSKIEKINSRIGSSTLTTKMPVHDKLVN
ncbi:hypothetical protein MSG28_008454, partial [Choristoneura fumiferana]